MGGSGRCWLTLLAAIGMGVKISACRNCEEALVSSVFLVLGNPLNWKRKFFCSRSIVMFKNALSLEEK